MSGYWNRPDLNAETLKDGWLLTGDLAYCDSDGFIFMLGRADDIINVGGEKVSPIEVENIAGQYEGISDCACLGIPDPDKVLGQVPILFVVPKGPAYREEQLIRFLTERMEKYKIPVKCIPVVSIPPEQNTKD